MSNSTGTFVWYDLLATDGKAAIAFYGHVIGWGTQAFDGAGEPYVMWTVGGSPVGGVMEMSEDARKTGTPSHWTGYVAVDDVDEMTKKAESLGGKTCHAPTDIPTVGRFSVIADPDGAAISLFKGNGPEMPPAPEGASGRVSWHELMAGDQKGALAFYSQLFGWEKAEAVESPMGIYQMYRKGDRVLGGMMTRPKEYPAQPHWLYYVTVDDLDAALERVKNSGGQVLHGPMEVPGGDRVAQCLDPQQAAFALHGK